MTTDTTQTGGFLGDPAQALTPPASAGGCCGGPATTVATVEVAQVSTCCGTVAEAKAEGSCCGTAAKEQAVASGAGCCG
ncbi:MAG: hypothetical protein HOV79_26555 [Hamadaea sp.]|nr:hypothetical protein [Hamadaea sp.]